MIRYNLTTYSYCFIVYAFVTITSILLTSYGSPRGAVSQSDMAAKLPPCSCTLHSRKFPTKPSVHIHIYLIFIILWISSN